MFTDLVGFSALSQKDESLALELLEEHRKLLRPLFAQYNGTEIKTIGDAFMVEFPSALEAARCAVEIQKILTAHTSVVTPERRMEVRIGLHVGDVIFKEGDVLGDGVNIASRIEPLAEAGGICVSESVAHQIENKIDLPLESLGEKELKGIEKPINVYNLVLPWKGETRSSKLAGIKPVMNRWKQPVIITLLLAIVAIWWSTNQRAPSIKSGQVTRLAVLPLANLMNDPDQEYFVDGMHDALITELSKLTGLTVISRQSVLRYKESDKSLTEIANELKVHALIEGSILRDRDEIRINVQLIEGETDQHLWADMFDRKLENVLALHRDIAKAIAAEIQVTLSPTEEAQLAEVRRVDPETYEAYLKGMYHLNKYDFEKGFNYLNEAVAKDPTEPLAYAGLAYGYITIGHGLRPTEDVWVKAQEAVHMAISLDETLAEAHAVLAMIKAYYEFDWDGAEKSFLRSIELNPNLAETHYHYAWYLALLGRMEEAIHEHERAMEIGPTVAAYTAWLGGLYWLEGDNERAIEYCRRSLKIRADNWGGVLVLASVLTDIGAYDDAIAENMKIPLTKWSLGRTYALAGQVVEANQVLKEIENGEIFPANAFGLAVLNTALEDKDEAFRWLAYKPSYSWVPWIRVWPWFESLQDDPRFDELLKSMNLPALE